MQKYPNAPHVRKHGPNGLIRYQSYKPWLRDEFTFRCVYCLERERWYPNGGDSFGVDHIKPKADERFKHLECVYDNLVYACNRCNTAKASHELLNPTEVGIGAHCVIDDEGNISGLTEEGKLLIGVLELDSEQVTETRKRYLGIARLYAEFSNVEEVATLYHDVFGFPDDLPDLSTLRPDENSRPDGCQDCYYARHKEDRLDKVCST